jgi:hypothetical protein
MAVIDYSNQHLMALDIYLACFISGNNKCNFKVGDWSMKGVTRCLYPIQIISTKCNVQQVLMCEVSPLEHAISCKTVICGWVILCG